MGRFFCLRSWFQLTAFIVIALGQLAPTAQASPGHNPGSQAGDQTQLSQSHCGVCHLVPDTKALPSETWPYILDLMGLYFGFDDAGLLSRAANLNVRRDQFDVDRYPLSPQLNRQTWLSLREHYESSPGSDVVPPPPSGEPLSLFDFEPVFLGSKPPITSLVRINEAGAGFILGSGSDNALYRFSASGALLAHRTLSGIPVQYDEEAGGARLTFIGSLSPSNYPGGAVVLLPPGGERNVVAGLHRPVHTVRADFDLDGDEDLLVCEFGHYVGRLAIYEDASGKAMPRHLLSAEPGAVSARIRDVDADGLPDIVALMAQAREEIVLYRNRGGLRFEAEVLLKSPPGFGYTDLHFADMTGDGRPELVVINGDNGDLPGPPLKSYHGIRIYQFDESATLTEMTFLYVPGAFRARPADFDGDGDVDIAVISFFPDPRRREQGFVFFENIGANKFQRRTITQGALAPWMTMDSGDIDSDGDIDLVLGSGYVQPPGSGESALPAALILRNRADSKR